MKGFKDAYFFPSFTESSRESFIYLDNLKPQFGDVVLDLGAYCVISAMTFAKAVGDSGRVIAVEPDPSNLSALYKNLERYPHPNITVDNSAVWSHSKTLMFSSEGNMGSMVVDRDHGRGTLIEVNAKTLEQIVEENGLSKIDGNRPILAALCGVMHRG